MLTTSSSSLPIAAGKRYYFDDFERNINTANGAVTDLDYIFANGRPVALVRTTGGSKTCYGVMTDRLGSLMSLYTTAGITQKFSYDAWGNRRNPLTGAALSSAELASANSITTRGYTGHEHIDEFALINMNARIYDAKLGMFISVDPQAGNYFGTYPYAYCGGDPLNRVDLTGEDWYEDKNGNLYWQEGHEDLDGYTRLGSSVSIQFGDNSFFNAYQNAGIIANQAVNAFDLIYMSQKLQNQFLGKDSPLSEASKSELFNGLNSRSMDAIARPVGETLVWNGFGELGGPLFGKAIGWAWGKFAGLFAGKGYESFIAFKKAYGAAGKGMAWHHIVEQNADNIARFGAKRIHNTKNIIRVPHGKGSIHAKVSGYYSSTMPNKSMRVRDYVKTLSFGEQYKFGIETLKKIGWKP